MFRLIVSLLLFFLGASATHASSSVPDEAVLKAGKRAFRQCANCHTLDPGAPIRVGPHLNGIIGRPVAGQKGYDYSEGMREREGVWTEEKLEAFIVKPRHAVEGTTMPYRGMTNPRSRKDLILYLKYIAEQEPSDHIKDEHSISLTQGDADHGASLAARCMACHTLTEDGKHGIGPNLFGVYRRDIASAPGFDYTQTLIKRKGIWDAAQLNAFMFETKRFDQGSHAAFLSLWRLSDRADIIAWLKEQK